MVQKGFVRICKTIIFVLVVFFAGVCVVSIGPTIKDNLSSKLNAAQKETHAINKSHARSSSLSAISNQTDAITDTITDTITAQTRPPRELTHIGFLKVHKAASSTMQNMFFRFGLKRNLTFVFTTHPNYFSRSAVSHLPLVKPKYRTGYDVLCNHGIFNYNIYSSLLPKDSVFLAIVREPLAVFISGVNYYSQKSQRIDYIAKVPGNRVQNLIRKPEVYDRGFFSYTKNVMARDFGFPITNDENRIQAKLEELSNVLKLVLIVEHFEESLILMKRYLNWSLRDILFLSNNVYGKGQTISDLTPDDIAKFKVRNGLDYKLYNYFYKIFWDKFHAEGNAIESEVEHFKRVLKQLKNFCDSKTHAMIVEQSQWSEQFTVSLDDCKLMVEDELKFIRVLRQKQGSELH